MLRYILVLILFMHWGCSSKPDRVALQLAVEPMESPAAPNSGEPNLFADPSGRIYMSWIESRGEQEDALLFSVYEHGKWSTPRLIARGDRWFVNWADFPSIIRLKNGTLVAHWLEKSGGAPYAYDVKMTFSRDNGESWSQPVSPHTDGTQTEHGFVSMLPWGEDRVFVTWLDGRKYAKKTNGEAPTHEMTIRAAVLDQAGNIEEAWLLDERTCDCCQTAATPIPGGVLVAYRDRSPQEIRDISYVRIQNGTITKPAPVHADGWTIPGCPVNGPALDSKGNTVAIAWFTMANQTPSVKVAFSMDGGQTFAQPIRVDTGSPAGRVDVVLLSEQELIVSWLETTENEAEIRIRKVRSDGQFSQARTVARTSGSRASGFPRMAFNGQELIFAWTEVGEPPRVRVASARAHR